MIDPNIRPGFIADEARFRARMDGLLAQADVVKASDEDLHWLLGDDALPKLARTLCARGPRLVLVTQGSAGVTGFHEGGELHVHAERVQVVDTVGAGDTFNAGFLAGLAEAGALSKAALAEGLSDDTLRAAMTMGTKAAAITVTRAGANPPRRSEIA